jgi:hypothetical protein
MNQGNDVHRELWVAEQAANDSARRKLRFGEQLLPIHIPAGSRHDDVIRLPGFGRKAPFSWSAPFRSRQNGDLLVALQVFPDAVTPAIPSPNPLDPGDQQLETWIRAKYEWAKRKLGEHVTTPGRLPAAAIAELFNQHGWRGVTEALEPHLNAHRYKVTICPSRSIAAAGQCKPNWVMCGQDIVERSYKILIHENYLNNPFCVAAILAHELCHVLYAERLRDGAFHSYEPSVMQEVSREEELTVDLLVFLHGLGEFQMRVARQENFTLGYFSQDNFERMQRIITRLHCETG